MKFEVPLVRDESWGTSGLSIREDLPSSHNSFSRATETKAGVS